MTPHDSPLAGHYQDVYAAQRTAAGNPVTPGACYWKPPAASKRNAPSTAAILGKIATAQKRIAARSARGGCRFYVEPNPFAHH
jgi:hypothetical protein